MAESQWWEAIAHPRATYVTVLRSDAGSHPRWVAGEVGVLVENTYPEKYDAMVLLPPDHSVPTREQAAYDAPPFLLGLIQDRAYYFYADDLAYAHGPGYGCWGPGREVPQRSAEERADADFLSAAIAHDAEAGFTSSL